MAQEPVKSTRAPLHISKDTKLPVFHHQVAGHFPLLRNSQGTICKPVQPKDLQEVKFYSEVEEVVPGLLPFVPGFFGVLDVVNMESPVTKSAPSTPSTTPSISSSSSSSSSTSSSSSSGQSAPRKRNHNAWALRCAERKRAKLTNSKLKYLVLEDVTSGFRRPCILDVKLGTQQHSARDPPEKVRSKMAKSAQSTSASLGVRFCGSQVYQPKNGHYVFRDKYFGRDLDDKGFQDSLRDFFHNGKCLRTDVLPAFLSLLEGFQTAVAEQRHYLFRSSSLLFIYEGSRRMPDSKCQVTPPASDKHGTTGAAALSASGAVDHSNGDDLMGSSSDDEPSEQKLVDLRFIDFAHSEVNVDKKPDLGVLKGIRSLITMLRSLASDSHDSCNGCSGPSDASSSAQAAP